METVAQDNRRHSNDPKVSFSPQNNEHNKDKSRSNNNDNKSNNSIKTISLNNISHDQTFASFWIDIKFWCFFLLETILRLVWRLFCLIVKALKDYFKRSFMSSYLGKILLKLRELIFNNSLQRQRLLDWLQEVLPSNLVPNNFTDNWSDGVLLCALCESIVPGTCPRYELLKSLSPISNVLLALNLIETCFEFRPRIAPEELLENSNNSERKLIQLLSQIRLSHSTQAFRIVQNRKLTLRSSFAKQTFFTVASQFFNDSFIRGTGIVHGVRSRRCCFAIYYPDHFPADEKTLILHVEILGPNSSRGLQKIQIDSVDIVDEEYEDDNHFNLLSNQKNYKIDCQQKLIMKAIRESRAGRYIHIPIFYENYKTHVQIEYIPIYIGTHTLNIIWKGQYVLGSPFRPDIQSSYYVEQNPEEIHPQIEPGLKYPLCLLNGYSNCDLDKYATVNKCKIIKKQILHGGKNYEFDDYFEKTFNKHTHNMDIDRRIIEANTKSDQSPDDSTPQTPILYEDDRQLMNERINQTNDDSLEEIDIELLTNSGSSWGNENSLRDECSSKCSTLSNSSTKSSKLKSDLERLKKTLKAIGTKKKKDKLKKV